MIGRRLLALFRKRRLDSELDGEVQAFLELAERDHLARGASPEEARRAARRDFGGIEQMKEIHRDTRAYPWLENIVRDFRYGLAALVRRPGLSAITISVLALGIGANTAMFSVIDAVLWKPLPFPEPERLVRLDEAPAPDQRNGGTTTLTYLDWKHQTSTFDAVSVEMPTAAALTTDGDPLRIKGSLVSASYFDVYGVRPQLGRGFAPNDDQPGAAAVVVISHALWQNRFGADPNILNRDLVLDGEPNRIIGVLPVSAFDRDPASYWKPIIFAPEQMTRGSHWLAIIARLKSGVSIEEANARMAALRQSLAKEMPAFKKNWTFVVDPFTKRLVGDSLRKSIYLGFAAVLMVLLIACSNIANLILAKGATRRKEMALRAALGASRGRLMLQLLVETWVLCLIGGAAGIAVAFLMLKAASPLLAPYLPFTADLSVDPRVLAFAAAAALTVSILVGLLPSLQTSFGHLTETLNQSARGSSGAGSFLRRAIVVGEVAASLILLCGAALLFRSLANLQSADTGVRLDHVITMSADLPLAAYPRAEDAVRFYRSLVERLEAVPGVARASVSQDLPLQGVQGGELFMVPGFEEPLTVRFKRIDPNYLAALDIPVIAGRNLSPDDRASTPKVLLINQHLAQAARAKFKITDPVGKAIRMSVPGYGKDDGSGAGLQIVGVIRDERTGDLQGPQDADVVYVPLAQFPREQIKILARTQTDPLAVVTGIREAVRQLDPHLPLADVHTMEQVKQESLTWARQPTWVIGIFAGIAALLAALGLYGVLSHAVTQQRREIGIRMALGASGRDVVGQILRNAFNLIALGLVVGIAGAFVLTRAIKTLLYEVSPLDPVAIVVACAAMIAVGLLAGYVPAMRAARVDPVTTLRDEG